MSGHIASLETQIERKLFIRHARGVKPTLIADELAARVTEALDKAESALAEIKARSADLTGKIHFCGAADILFDLISNRLGVLANSGLTMRLIPVTDQDIVEMLVKVTPISPLPCQVSTTSASHPRSMARKNCC